MNRLAYTAGFSVVLAHLLLAGRTFARPAVLPEQESGKFPRKQGQTKPGRTPGVSSDLNAPDTTNWVPMTKLQKLRLGALRTVNPVALGGSALKAGIFQLTEHDSEFGEGASGYGKRVGFSIADSATNKMLRTFVLPTLLHQDPRYFPKGSGSFGSRLGYSLTRVFRTRTDAGGHAFNWSRILGSLGSGALSNTYYPVVDRGAALTFANAGWSTLTEAGVNVFKEFWPDIRRWRANKRANPPSRAPQGRDGTARCDR